MTRHATPLRYCGAVAWLRVKDRYVPIVPWIAVKYCAIAVACAILFIGIVEWRLTELARAGRVASNPWHAENERITRMNYAKVKQTGTDPLWRSAGLPVPEVKKNRRRILVIGDSFIWGDGYANANNIWWRQLQRELHQRGYWDVDVLAAGVNGASTQDHLRWLRDERLVDKTSADLVILGYVTNDADLHVENGRYLVKLIGRDIRQPQWPIVDRVLGKVAPNLGMQVKQRLSAKWQASITDAYNYNEWELKLLESPNIDAYEKIVQELSGAVRSTGKPFFVLTLPNWPGKDQFGPRYAPIKPIFERAGLPFYDILDDFVNEYPPGGEVLQWGINPVNGHPSPISTRFFARKAVDILERRYPAILGPKLSHSPDISPEINDWMPPTAAVVSTGHNQWELTYPTPSESTLELPLGKRHVMLAFAEPVQIGQIELAGNALLDCELHVTVVDPRTGIEMRDHIALGSRQGSALSWRIPKTLNGSRINTLKISANLDNTTQGASRVLRVAIDVLEKGTQP